MLGTGLGRILNLIAMILAARILGQGEFGALGLTQSTLGVFALLAGGALGATVTRFAAAERARNPDRVGVVISLVLIAGLISSVLFSLIIAFVASGIFEHFLKAPGLGGALSAGALLVAIGVLRGMSDAVLAGFERFDRIAIGRVVEGAAVLVAVPFLVGSLGVAGGVLALASGALAALLLSATFARAELSEAGLSLRLTGVKREWRVLRDFSLPSLLAGSISTPALWISMIILAKFGGGVSQLGLYNAAYQWYSPLVFIPTVLSAVAMPLVAQIWGSGDIRRFARQVAMLTAGGAGFTLVAAGVLSIASPWLLSLMGSEFQSARLVLVILLLSAPAHFVSLMATAALDAMSAGWLKMATHLVWGISIVTLSTILVPQYGALGLATGYLVSYLLMAACKVTLVHIVSQRALRGEYRS